MRFHRILCILLCLVLAAGFLTGCGSSGASFTWRVNHVPANLDPQIAQESSERIAVTNLYRGLTRIDENGDAVLDCAESYTVSEDGLTYTFTLKDTKRNIPSPLQTLCSAWSGFSGKKPTAPIGSFFPT